LCNTVTQSVFKSILLYFTKNKQHKYFFTKDVLYCRFSVLNIDLLMPVRCCPICMPTVYNSLQVAVVNKASFLPAGCFKRCILNTFT